MSIENYIVLRKTESYKEGNLVKTENEIIWEGDEPTAFGLLRNKYDQISSSKSCRLIEYRTRSTDYLKCIVLEYIEDINDTDCLRVKYRIVMEVV